MRPYAEFWGIVHASYRPRALRALTLDARRRFNAAAAPAPIVARIRAYAPDPRPFDQEREENGL